MARSPRRTRPPEQRKHEPHYAELWAIVDRALLDVLQCHADYFTPKGKQVAFQRSVCKRIVGRLTAALRKK